MTTSSLVLAFAAVAVGLNVAVVVDSSHDSDLDFDCDPFCPEFRACAEGVHAGDPFVSRACAIMLKEAGRGAGADAAFKYLEIFWVSSIRPSPRRAWLAKSNFFSHKNTVLNHTLFDNNPDDILVVYT